MGWPLGPVKGWLEQFLPAERDAPLGSAGVGACNRAARWMAQIDILKFECRKAEQNAALENHRRSERHDFRFRTHVGSHGLQQMNRMLRVTQNPFFPRPLSAQRGKAHRNRDERDDRGKQNGAGRHRRFPPIKLRQHERPRPRG